MSPYGSAVVECRRDQADHAAFVVSASSEVFAAFDAGDDPVADLVKARQCAASLAETVFVANSVELFWTGTARPEGMAA